MTNFSYENVTIKFEENKKKEFSVCTTSEPEKKLWIFYSFNQREKESYNFLCIDKNEKIVRKKNYLESCGM